MKELYVSPEVEITCFAPVEALANDSWQTWDARSGSTTSPVFEGSGDGEPID